MMIMIVTVIKAIIRKKMTRERDENRKVLMIIMKFCYNKNYNVYNHNNNNDYKR